MKIYIQQIIQKNIKRITILSTIYWEIKRIIDIIFALYSSCQDQVEDVIDAMSINRKDTNFALLQEKSKKKNI